MRNTNLNKDEIEISLKNNLLINKKEDSTNVVFTFSTSLFREYSTIYKLMSKLHWIHDTYVNSIEYEDFNIKKYEPKINNLNFKKEINFPYVNFIQDLMFKIKNILNITYIEKDSFYTIVGKSSELTEDHEEKIISLIKEETLKFYEKTFNKDFLTITYSFSEDKNSSVVQFICKNFKSRVKINNASKLIPQIIMKRAINRLSIVNNKLNEDFRKIGKTRPMYKVFFAGRRNAFEEIDKSIKESIIKGI